MNGSKKVLFALFGAAAMAALAPSDAGAQVSEVEVYRLSTVAGEQLPAIIEQNGDCRDELHAATLTLGTDGTWLLEMDEQEFCANHTSSDTDDEDGTYHLEGETIHFMDDDGDPFEADNDPNELEVDLLREATRTENGLRVVISDEDTVLEFTR